MLFFSSLRAECAIALTSPDCHGEVNSSYLSNRKRKPPSQFSSCRSNIQSSEGGGDALSRPNDPLEVSKCGKSLGAADGKEGISSVQPLKLMRLPEVGSVSGVFLSLTYALCTSAKRSPVQATGEHLSIDLDDMHRPSQ